MNSFLKKFNLKKNLMTSNYNNILYSRSVLYIFFFLSILNLYYLLANGLTGFIVLFFLVGFLTSFFSKNMIVIMCVALAVTNIFRNGTSMRSSEGFREGVTDSTSVEPPEVSDSTIESLDTDSKMKPLMDNSQGTKDPQTFTDSDIERITKLTTQYEKLLDIQKKMKTGFEEFKEPFLDATEAISALKTALKQ